MEEFVMKKLAVVLFFVPAIGFAQMTGEQAVPYGFHTHDGFFLSLTGGPAFGNIVLEASNTYFKKMEMSGVGFQIDLKIGGTISEENNLILTFDVLSRAISAPDMTVDGRSASTTTDVTAGDVLYGIGVTKYFTPSNIFINATIGLARFTINVNNTQANSESGLGGQLKIGKEWWVGDNWGLGVAAGVGFASADDKKDSSIPAYSGKLSTTKFFVLFNATFN
jgi:hypothetical protein